MNESRKAACKLPHNIPVKERESLHVADEVILGWTYQESGEVAYETISWWKNKGMWHGTNQIILE